MNRRAAVAIAAALALLAAAGRARAKPLPPQGPPPDPGRGERYDGRPVKGESAARKVALLVPRVVLLPPRLVLALVRYPVLVALDYTEQKDDQARMMPARSTLSGIGPIIAMEGSGYPAVGVRIWSRKLFGRGLATTSISALTSGPRYLLGAARISPNPALPFGVGATLRGLRQTDEPWYGLPGPETFGMTSEDLVTYAEVNAADGAVFANWRPGGGAGAWRGVFSLGGGLRRFSQGSKTPVDPATTPGFDDGATFVRVGVGVERLGPFDVSRQVSGLDLTFAATPTAGVGAGDQSRYVSALGRAAYGLPMRGGRALVLTGLAGDQWSWGDDPVDFYDLLSPSTYGLMRGFATRRFRGPSMAAAAVDARFPLQIDIDGFLFVEEGGAFGEHFADFGAAGLHTSFGGGTRIFWRHYALELLLGYGVGDGFRLSISLDTGG